MSGAPSQSLLGVAMRDLGRLRRVAAIVARHGFGGLLARTPIGKRLSREATISFQTDGESQDPAAIRFTRLLADLGPTYIKFGQILSMRRDLLSADYIEALETLQDRAPVLPFEDVRSVVETGLGSPLGTLFLEFDETPHATASVAQTHLARTQEGERVVVKVQRPGIEETMRSDLDLLYLGAQILESSIDEMKLVGATEVIAEFERALLAELDFGAELSNLVRAGKSLDKERRVTVPQPFSELSCRTVLTMQFFEGCSIRELEPRSERARHVTREILHVACKQVFLDGFFHGDPHSGNVLVNDRDELCLIDFGQVGTLTELQREEIVTLIVATIAGDHATIARVLLRMGTPTARVNLGELRAEIERIRGHYFRVSSVDDYDAGGFAEEFMRAAGRFRIKLAPQYTLLAKAAGTLEGIVRQLDPEADIVGITRPYVEQVIAARYSPSAMLKDLVGDASGLGSMVRHLPAQMDQILHDVETGNVQVRVVAPALDPVAGMLHQLGGRISLALFAFAMTLATATLLEPAVRGTVHWLVPTALGLMAAGAWTMLTWWQLIARGRPLKVGPWIRFLRR